MPCISSTGEPARQEGRICLEPHDGVASGRNCVNFSISGSSVEPLPFATSSLDQPFVFFGGDWQSAVPGQSANAQLSTVNCFRRRSNIDGYQGLPMPSSRIL